MPTSTNNVIIGPDETATLVSNAGHIYNSQSYDTVVVCVRTPIPSFSGGRQLENAITGSIMLRSASGNHIMFLGGVGMNAPYSGRGLSLFGNETITLPVKNMNAVSVMSTISGEFIECMGFQTGEPTNLDVSGIFINPDPTPPTLSATSPLSGASGVAVNANIYADFSECMDPASANVSGFSVRLSGDATHISGIVFVDSFVCNRVWFVPYSGLLTTSKVYVAEVGTSMLMDMQGNGLLVSGQWPWTTTNVPPGPDVTAPRVSGTNPASGMMDIDLGMSPTITMSESLQSGTVNNFNVHIFISGHTEIPANISLGADLRTITIDPIPTLNQGTIYTIEADNDVKDLAGNGVSPDVDTPFLTLMNDPIVYVVSDDGNTSTFSQSKFRIGGYIESGSQYIGNIVTGFRAYMRKTSAAPNPLSGAASGIQFHIQKASDNSRVIFNNMFETQVNPADLTFSMQAFDFHNHSHSYQLAQGDRIQLEWLSGSASGQVKVAKTNTNVVNGMRKTERTGSTYSGSTYQEYASEDLAGIMWVK